MGKLALTSETLTTAVAGTMEYDGGELYFTPTGIQRGLIPNYQFYRLNSTLVGSNVNTAQNILGVGVTLSASTVYAFELQATMLKTAGSTAHTVNFGWGGTATVNNIIADVRVLFTTSSVNTYLASTNYNGLVLTQTTAVASTGTSGANTNLMWSCIIKGTVSINAGGTLIPQYTCSAAPGGAYTTQIGSYMLIYPIGAAGSNTNIGTWA